MIAGIILASVGVLFYTIFGAFAQYFNLNPVDLILARGTIQFTTFVAVLFCTGQRPELSKVVIGGGLIAFACHGSYILVLHLLPLGPAVIFGRSTSPFTAFFARVLANEPVSLIKGICIAILLIGQLLIIQPPFLFSGLSGVSSMDIQECFGIAVGLFCAIMNGLLLVYIAITNVSKSEVLLMGAALSILGGLILGPWMSESQLFHSSVSELPMNILKVGSGAMFAVTALIMWTFSIGKAPSVLLSLISSTECVTSFGTQILLFKEDVNYLQIIGAGLVLVSLTVATFHDSYLETKKMDYIKMDERTIKATP